MFTKKTIALLLTLVMIASMVTVSMAANDVKIVLDGKEIKSNVAPVIKDGTTLVPARAIFEAIGADVAWNPVAKEVSISTAAADVKLTIDSLTAKVNGQSKKMVVPAQIIDGSTMVPLRFIAEAVGAEVAWDDSARAVKVNYFSNMSGTLKIGGSTTVQPLATEIADKLMAANSGLAVTIAGTGSGDGVKGAGSGQYNIGNASRAIKDSEKTEYADLNDFQIASDGIAVVVNPSNPVGELTKEQVYKIFTGEIVNWADVGGKEAPIFVQTREEGSGTLGAFSELAIEEEGDSPITSTAAPHASNGLVKEAVSQDENAIGFISFGYLDNSVKGLKIEGVDATVKNAISGAFPYVRPLNVCTKGRPQIGSNTAKFIDYYKSVDGLKIVAEDYIAMK